MWQAGGCARCWVRWGREIVYSGGSRVCYTHLGCFGAQGGTGGGCRAYIRSHINQFLSQLGKRCQVDLLRLSFCSWARCAWFFIEKKAYCSKYSTFIYNLVFFKYMGRREWMDGIGSVWMMTSQLGKHSRSVLVLGSVFHRNNCIL